ANESVRIDITDGASTTIDIRDADNDPNNENQTVSAGTGISVSQSGDDFAVTNTAPDQTVALTDGGNGNVTIGGTYPNFTIDVPDATVDTNTEYTAGSGLNLAGTVFSADVSNTAGNALSIDANGLYVSNVDNVDDADSDPNNENQTVSAGTGISVSQSGDDFAVTNTAPDQTVALTDGGNGNVTIGGTYPNFTIDVPNATVDTDEQDLGLGTNGVANQSVELTITDGAAALIDIRDADNDPNNENQTVSAGTGISVSQSGDDFAVTNTAPDQTVALTDGGNGNVTIGGTYPNFTIDVPDATVDTDDQTLSLTGNILAISEGNSVNLSGYENTDDQTLSLTGNTLEIANGNSVNLSGYENTDDQTLSLTGTDLTIDGGNTIDISGIDTDTDDQTLSISGDQLSISEGNSVTIPSPNGAETIVEAAPNSDISVSGTGTSANPYVIANTRPDIFYPPSIAVDVSSTGNNRTINLHAEYLAQYGTPEVRSAGAPAAIPTYANTELYYYVTYYDPTVFANVTVNASGIMQYDVIASPTDYNTLINVVFVAK
ncbi:beta strand repeat-containing protein, partial [Maribacter ulvicola]